MSYICTILINLQTKVFIPMKIIHLSQSDISGGASRAAYRIHKMLIKNRINSSMWVDIKKI